MHNPPPSSPPPPGVYPPPGGYADLPHGSGPVKQVRVVAVLLIIQGSLECLMGLLLFWLGPFMYRTLTEAQNQSRDFPIPPALLSGIYMKPVQIKVESH